MDLKLQSHLFSQHCPCFRHIRKIQNCQKMGCWRDYFILLGVLFLFSLALFGEQEESPMTTYNSSAAYNWASSLGMLHKTRESQILKSPITEDFNAQSHDFLSQLLHKTISWMSPLSDHELATSSNSEADGNHEQWDPISKHKEKTSAKKITRSSQWCSRLTYRRCKIEYLAGTCWNSLAVYTISSNSISWRPICLGFRV